MSKLKWGLIGGGEGSQIGPAHRMAAGLDGEFEFVAAALDLDPIKGAEYARRLGVVDDRAYGDWREMLDKERARPDKIDLVTIATPNSTHYEITKAFLESGFHVLCEKPMTMTVEEAESIVKTAQCSGKICAVNYGYSGYSLVRQMRSMVKQGELGKIRLINAEFAHGHHADAGDANNPRVRWRYDSKKVGVSGVFADCGIHALHLASFVSGQQVTRLSADFISAISDRELEDDAMVNFRMDGGATGRLWTSAVAVGRIHGLTLQVFGEKGGLRWAQEQPNQLFWMPLNSRVQTIERGDNTLSAEAIRSSRVTIGHAEGMPLAFANIYADIAQALQAQKQGKTIDSGDYLYPKSEDGLRSIAAIYAAVESAQQDSRWVNAAPPGWS